MPTYTELRQYDSTAQEYAQNHTNYMFHNSGNEHALIICKNLFANAKKHIRIAAKQLYNDDVVNRPEYIEAMHSFLSLKGSRLDILISKLPELNKDCRERTFYGMLYDSEAYKQGRVCIKHANGKTFKENHGEGNPINFCTGDDLMYRYENDITNRKAIANYNDPNTTANLINAFDSIFPTLTDEVRLENYFS